MLASRAEHVQKLILPALAKGSVVLCDRFIDSTTAYQGYGRGLPVKTIQLMNQFAIMGRYPDLTVIIDIDSAKGLERAARKAGLDRIESAGQGFHSQVREGFKSLSTEDDRYFLVDGNRSISTIHEDIYSRVIRFLNEDRFKIGKSSKSLSKAKDRKQKKDLKNLGHGLFSKLLLEVSL